MFLVWVWFALLSSMNEYFSFVYLWIWNPCQCVIVLLLFQSLMIACGICCHQWRGTSLTLVVVTSDCRLCDVSTFCLRSRVINEWVLLFFLSMVVTCDGWIWGVSVRCFPTVISSTVLCFSFPWLENVNALFGWSTVFFCVYTFPNFVFFTRLLSPIVCK